MSPYAPRVQRGRAFELVLVVCVSASCVPYKNTPLSEIDKLATLPDVMDAQGTIIDPVLTRTGESKYSEDDWAAFADVSDRIRATAARTKVLGVEAGKPPRFGELADRLQAFAEALGKATAARDADLASQAVTDMKSTCKACHAEFRVKRLL